MASSNLMNASAPWRNNILLMAIAGAGLALCAADAFRGSFNFDIWYMLATGREIVQNGIPYENPFALYEGMGIIVQQWMLCVLVYGIYSVGGFVGLALWSMFLAVVLMLSLYRVGRLVKGDRYGGELLMFLLVMAMPAFLSYITMCSSVYSMIAYCWVMFFCEKYRRTGQYRWLGLLMPLMVVHAGFHLSLAVFDLVIIGCYLVPDVLKPFHRRGKLEGIAFAQSAYKRLPLLIALAGAAVALCINPYGICGALYLFLSYGAADYGGAVPEMRAFAPVTYGVYGVSALIMLVLAGLAIGRLGLKRINLPLTLLVMGTALMTFQHVRNMWLIAPFSYVLVAGAMHGWSLDFAKLRKRRAQKKEAASGSTASAYPASAFGADAGSATSGGVLDASGGPRSRAKALSYGVAAAICVVAVVGAGAMVVQDAPTMADQEKTGQYSPTALVRAIEQDAGGKDVRLFNPVRLGGYLEWSGFKVSMDSRLETWNAPINGIGRDYYTEYVDMTDGEWKADEIGAFLDENGFEYLISEKGTPLHTYLEHTEGYSNMLGTGNYVLWKHLG